MKLDKIVYEVREALNAISDDRRVDTRYIAQVVSLYRADLIRKLLTRRTCITTLGMQQHIPMEVETVSRSIFPGLELPCVILRTTEKVPKLIYEGAGYKWYAVRTADVRKDTIETISWARVPYLTFEFNTVYSFLAPGVAASDGSMPPLFDSTDELSNYYMYVISKDNFDLKYLIVSGIFENPLEADPDLEEFPLNASEWSAIKPNVINAIVNKPGEDPLNNSEPDDGRRLQGLQQAVNPQREEQQ